MVERYNQLGKPRLSLIKTNHEPLTTQFDRIRHEEHLERIYDLIDQKTVCVEATTLSVDEIEIHEKNTPAAMGGLSVERFGPASGFSNIDYKGMPHDTVITYSVSRTNSDPLTIIATHLATICGVPNYIRYNQNLALPAEAIRFAFISMTELQRTRSGDEDDLIYDETLNTDLRVAGAQNPIHAQALLDELIASLEHDVSG